MKKFIKKLCALAALSMAPLALNSFNKPTFAMESFNLENEFQKIQQNFKKIKQNYEAELKTVNEKIQATIARFDNKLKSTSKTSNRSNNAPCNESNCYFTYLEDLKHVCLQKYRLIKKTVDLLRDISLLPEAQPLFLPMVKDLSNTIDTLNKYYEICGGNPDHLAYYIIENCRDLMLDIQKITENNIADLMLCFFSKK